MSDERSQWIVARASALCEGLRRVLPLLGSKDPEVLRQAAVDATQELRALDPEMADKVLAVLLRFVGVEGDENA